MSVSAVPIEDYTVRELLIGMDGKLALIQKDNEVTQRDLTAIRDRTHELAQSLQINYSEVNGRLNKIEQAAIADRNFLKGEKQGFDKAVKAVYALCTVCGLSGIAAAAKFLLT